MRHWFFVLHDFHRKIMIKTENFKNDLNKIEHDDYIYYLKTLRVMSHPYAKMPAKTSRYRPTARHLKNPLVLRTVAFFQITFWFFVWKLILAHFCSTAKTYTKVARNNNWKFTQLSWRYTIGKEITKYSSQAGCNRHVLLSEKCYWQEKLKAAKWKWSRKALENNFMSCILPRKV